MAVYTEITDEELSAFLVGYDIGHLTAFRGIAEGVENSNFLLRTEKDGQESDYILTLYEKRVNPDDLPWFLGFMRHLATEGVSCPLPVCGRDGEALRTLAGRPAAITTFLSGVWPRHIHNEHCQPLGEALARLHVAGGSYLPVRANSLGPDAWRPLLQDAAQSDRQTDETKRLIAELDLALDRILPDWPDADRQADLPRGQIHADLFPDNVFFLDHKVSGLIDFYFACTDFLAYDVAICLNAWCFSEDGAFNATFARQMIAGYETVRPLTSAEREALPVLCAGAAMRFALTRLYDWINTPPDAMVTRKNPMDYVHRLRFHLAADNSGAYGV
ncbi:homoserine kinase [Acetobacter sp.]|jgi:homoserine kinase type II|uniref:homoserine kinase n=1 Tax=Acetobacter sp. TaxID=440 RepID=UPI0025C2625E|nr:homoserine kinase [Acetobacter sp.]MCH4091364.1 homoserine kinase [Acetobacter sp.]MCI1299342.1 homoserine kinase [Acetobacter sp.]MCI1316654.1 homoserine kinase [Acetobacter sp.]